MNKGTKISLIFAVFFLFLIGFVTSQNNSTIQGEAEFCLESSEMILEEFKENNFNYERIQDSLDKAQDIYEAQIVLLAQGEKVDFSLIIPYCEDIKNIKEIAFDSFDQYSSLKKFYAFSITSEMNSSSIDVIIGEIDEEMNSERYENIPSLIDEAYEEISKVKSSYTTLNLFYTSTTRGLKMFFQKNWKPFVITLSLLFILFLLFNKKIRRKIIENKLKKIELRKETIKELIRKTQKDYFQEGKMSEANYSLRINKFAEFVRDIDRQIPLFKEQLLKLEKKESSKFVKMTKLKSKRPKEIKPKKRYKNKKQRRIKMKKTKKIKKRK